MPVLLTHNYDTILDETFGIPGTAQCRASEAKARTLYTAQLIHEARREARVSLKELARRIHTTTNHLSQIENGDVDLSAGTFYQIIDALGMRLEIGKTL